MREIDARVRQPGVVGRGPIEIALAVRGETKAFAPALCVQVQRIFLALEIERKKRLDPLRRILRLQGPFGVGSGAPNFNFLGEDSFVIAVEREQSFREVRADSLLDLRWI